jgi:geranylgeranyl pyrophosphate synthase
MLGEVGAEREQALARYGRDLGICFQMVDDILDFTADEKVLGKPALNDLREGKLTLPVIFLLRGAGSPAREMVRAVLDDRGFGRVSREALVDLARQQGAIDEARALAERYAEQARQALRVFEPSRYREALEALPDFILARDH